MKQYILIFTFLLYFFQFHDLYSQANAVEYNLKGDSALNRLDYPEARMWYSMGVENCDKYSIRQLTKIWDIQKSKSMGNLMSRCLNCLQGQMLSEDPDVMFLLSEYYEKGIVVSKDSLQSQFYKKKAVLLLSEKSSNTGIYTPIVDTIRVIESVPIPEKPKKPFFADFEYFLAFAPSYTMPLGLTAGILNDNKIGTYFSFRTNFNFRTSDLNCSNSGILNYSYKDTRYYQFSPDKNSWNNIQAIAGILFPVVKNGFISLGVGYGKRDFLCYITEYDRLTETPVASNWYFNTESSYNGVSMEVGGVYRFKQVVFSIGCNTIKFKDLDVTAGVGYVF